MRMTWVFSALSLQSTSRRHAAGNAEADSGPSGGIAHSAPTNGNPMMIPDREDFSRQALRTMLVCPLWKTGESHFESLRNLRDRSDRQEVSRTAAGSSFPGQLGLAFAPSVILKPANRPGKR
jgi:hypothetical protein